MLKVKGSNTSGFHAGMSERLSLGDVPA